MKRINYLPLLNEWKNQKDVDEDLKKIYSYLTFQDVHILLKLFSKDLFSENNIDFPLYELTQEEFKNCDDINFGEVNPNKIKEHEKYIDFDLNKYKYYRMCHYTITNWDYYYIRVMNVI